MLITDNSQGTSDGKEHDQLQALVAVGSEFITYQDSESTVQKSGEFARIEKQTGEPAPRFLLLHETSQTYDENWTALTGNELRGVAPNVKLRKRSRLYLSDIDQTNGDLPFREIGSFKAQTRISRNHGPSTTSQPRALRAVHEANYTAQAGKRRLFAKGDGKVWLVREVDDPADPRYFNDSLRTIDDVPVPHTKKRGLRAARVEVVEVNTDLGTTSKPIFSFAVYSGLSFDPEAKYLSDSIRATSEMSDSINVYAAFSGVLYGSSLNIPSVQVTPTGGDASDTYAIAEPAVAKIDGKEYLSLVAVFPASDDVYDGRSAGPYRLTCQRTMPNGGIATDKIVFPTLPTLPKHYLAARGMSLHRVSPTTLVLRVNVHAMQFGAGGTISPAICDAFFLWSHDNAATWTYAPVTSGFPGIAPYGGLLVQDQDTLLAFSWFSQSAYSPVQVHRITSSGTAQIATIAGAVFSQGLLAPVGAAPGIYFVPYLPIGFGGAVYKKGDDGKKHKRLWMQFDPYWNYQQTTPQVLSYPGSRPMLLVSDDLGATWERKLLPVPWAFRVGFVVSIDESTLAVPVFSARSIKGSPLGLTIYLSSNGGETWRASSSQLTLPGETWVDGNIVLNAQFVNGSGHVALEQDIGDSALEYNRGELLPMLVLRDKNGAVLPANPARPWMNNYKIKEPDYA